MAAPAIRWFAFAALFCCLLLPLTGAIYCDEDDCYDLLGVSQSANVSEIKKAYYKLSLKYHPDKNPDPESRKLFVKVANAYEILKDEATREQYDYAIAHPEEVFYNAARYYHAYYGHKTDPRAVFVGLLVLLSGFQYLNQWTRYTQTRNPFNQEKRRLFTTSKCFVEALDLSTSGYLILIEAVTMVKKTPAYKNKLRALELERTGGITNKKKGYRQMDKETEEELSKELDLEIHGAGKPSMWKLLAVRFLLLPYTLGKLLLWGGCWFWRYRIKRASYTWDDASYLTQTSLRVPLDKWSTIDESMKSDLIHRRLWEKDNMESYQAEMRKETKRRR